MATPKTKLSREQKNFTLEDMKCALKEVKCGSSVYSAAKKYNIPKTTLQRRVTGKYSLDTKKGKKTVLSTQQEQYLEDWLLHVFKIGFPVTKTQLIDSVAHLVKELKIEHDFRNGRPGRYWYEGFMQRHPAISTRVSQNLTRSRAAVSEEKIRNWFSEVYTFLKQENVCHVLSDPNRVFNCDESALFLSPKKSTVLAKKGTKAVYSVVANDEKECLTTLITGNAAGSLAPSMVVYQYKRIPAIIAENMPKGWAIATSESGWMTGETFFEYITNIFHPWLIEKNIPLLVILFLDGHASHLTLHLSKFCNENGIILIALIANSTHILQPLDVSVFHPLKVQWKKVVRDWRMENDGNKIKKEHFATLLSKVLEDPRHKQNLISGFRTCGLCPFDANAIDYTKYFGSTQSHPPENAISSDSSLNHVNFIEKNTDPEKLIIFKNTVGPWSGATKNESLFLFWKKTCTKETLDHQESLRFGDTTFENNIPHAMDNSMICANEKDFQMLINESEIIFENSIINEQTPSKRDTHLETIYLPYSEIIPTTDDVFIITEPSGPTPVLSIAQQPQTESQKIGEPIIPTPFKKNLFWPEMNKTVKT